MGPIQQKHRPGSHWILFVTMALLTPGLASAAADPLFRTFQTFPQGQNLGPFGRLGYAAESATADFNGDGLPDIVLSNQTNIFYGSATTVSVLLHQASHLYAPMYLTSNTVTVTGTDACPVHIAAADLDGDGKQDIVTGNYVNGATTTPKSISVVYGQGNGLFWKLRIKALANYQGGLAVRDLNNDGRADVACLVSAGGSNKGVGVMYATQDSLADPVVYGSSAALSGFGIGDATADGIQDLILTYPTSIVVLTGDNAGNFSPGLPSLPGPSVAGASMAHMNGDAILDMVQFERDTYSAIIRIGSGFGGYQAPVTVPMGAVQPDTRDLLTGDVDGDGDTDLIGYSSASGQVAVRKNDGAASFGSATLFTGMPGAGVPTLVDANQDSRPDIVTGDAFSQEPNAVAVLLNDGSGGFPSSFKAINANSEVGALGDFNRDGKVDLAHPGPSGIDIGFGNGDGTFTFQHSFATTLTATAMAVADINRDGKLDLICEFSFDVVLYLGAGDGTFSVSQTLSGNYLLPRCVADLDRNGRPDLILTNSNNSQLRVYLQLTDGTYGAPASYTPSVGAHSVNFGDWNRDGITDLAVAGSGGLLVYPGLAVPAGGLGAPVVLASGVSYLDACALDANHDGQPDLAGRVTLNGGATGVGVNVFLGSGNGVFGAPTSFGTTSVVGWTVDSWDANRDGLADLVTRGHSGSDHVEVLLGTGTGVFGHRTSYGLGYTNGNSFFADLNNDAMPDIVAGVAAVTSDTTNILTTLATPPTKPVTLREVTSYSTINFPGFVAVGDLNRDGKLDAVAGAYASDPGIAVLLGNGNGTLGASTTLGQSRYGGKVSLADFNRDGILDIAALDNSIGSQRVATFLGVGNGTFGARIDYPIPTGQDFDIGDMNRDGIPDIVMATPTTVQVLLGAGNGTFTAGSSTSLGGATVVDLDLADVDRDGDLDVVIAAGTVKIIHANGAGTLGSPTTLPPPATDCRNVAIADFSRDGIPDIIAQDGATYYEIWGSLTGTPSTYTTRTLSFGALDMKVGEAASDGVPYLFMTRNSGGLETYSVSTTGVLTHVDSHVVLQSPSTIALADMDRDGMVDVVSVGANNWITVNLHTSSGTITSADGPSVSAAPRVALRQNYPNPFNPRTTIRYTLPRAERVQLRVFDVHGRLVATLRDGTEPAGERRVEWNGRDHEGHPVGSGVYLYRLTTESGEDRSRRMVMVK